MVWALDALLEPVYAVAELEISSSRALVAEAFVEVEDEPVDAAVEVELGAVAANQAPRPRNDAALTAPVMRRARRAGWGFRFSMR